MILCKLVSHKKQTGSQQLKCCANGKSSPSTTPATSRQSTGKCQHSRKEGLAGLPLNSRGRLVNDCRSERTEESPPTHSYRIASSHADMATLTENKQTTKSNSTKFTTLVLTRKKVVWQQTKEQAFDACKNRACTTRHP